MQKLPHKENKILSKLLSFLIVAISVAMIVLFRGWIFEQCKHVLSFYYVSKGDKAYFNHHLQEAINEYNFALKLYPGHVRARYNLGNIYASYEDYYSAINCYQKALGYDPEHLNSRMNLGVLYSEETHDYDKAIEEFQKATQTEKLVMTVPFIFDNGYYIRANIAAAYYNLGLAYKYKSLLYDTNKSMAMVYLRKAAINYKKSVQIDPNVYEAHHNYALALHLLGQYNQAMVEYCKAINLKPLNYEAHYNLAVLLEENKQYKDSMDELEKTGLILDIRGKEDKLRYIFAVMNDMGTRIIPKYNQYGHLIDDKNALESNDITYLNGKVIVSDDIDKAIVDNFKQCNYCKECSPEK